jgi:hypothetical protein
MRGTHQDISPSLPICECTHKRACVRGYNARCVWRVQCTSCMASMMRVAYGGYDVPDARCVWRVRCALRTAGTKCPMRVAYGGYKVPDARCVWRVQCTWRTAGTTCSTRVVYGGYDVPDARCVWRVRCTWRTVGTTHIVDGGYDGRWERAGTGGYGHATYILRARHGRGGIPRQACAMVVV